MEPAQSIIHKLGGEAAVSAITKTASTAPYRWQYPRDKGGTGGRIPQRYHPVLLNYAQEHAIALSAEDFLPPDYSPSSVPDQEEPAPQRQAS